MMSRFVFLLALLVAVAVAPKTVQIQVGGVSNVFSPDSVTIEPGDSVKFTWAGGDHTLTEEADPGTCIEDTDASGNDMERQSSATVGFEYTFQPTNARDMYFFCENHCDPSGTQMAGQIVFDLCEFPTGNTCSKRTLETVGQGETCDRFACVRSTGTVQRVCKKGLTCERSNTIDDFSSCESVIEAPIGGSCAADTAVCVDGLYAVDCQGNDVCGNDRFLMPGEACTTDPKTVCDNDDCCAQGSCTSYATSKCPSGFCCEFAARDESCLVGPCSAADYCDPLTVTCVARNPAGTAGCAGINDFCAPGATCVSDGAESSCVPIFSVGLGANCDYNSLACAADLYCGDDGNCKEPTRKQGDLCSVDSDCGPAPAECLCNSDDGELQCELPFMYSKQLINSIENFVECAAAAGCFVDTTDDNGLGSAAGTFFPGSCIDSNCKGATENVLTLAAKAQGQSASSSIGLAVAALVAAVALAL